MLLSGQVFMNLGWFDRARSPQWRMPCWARRVALVFFLDPINLKLGRPGMFRDWQNGWYGRTLAAFAGGLLCGPLEHYRYFAMPLIGLIGFTPFGLECWVMWQTLRIPLEGMVEPLPDEASLL